MKNTIYENGVYIYANGTLHTPESYEGTTGKVVVVMGSDAFEVSPEQVKNVTWEKAMEFAKSKGGNLPNRWQRMTMWNYRESLNMALLKIGGAQLGEVGDDWEWLCEEYSSNYAWYFTGPYGYMYHYTKRTTYTGRPIFNFSLDTLAN